MPKQRCEVCRGKGICSTCYGACGTCHATGEIEVAPVPKKGTRAYNKYMNGRPFADCKPLNERTRAQRFELVHRS
jgi:hypothetical protein